MAAAGAGELQGCRGSEQELLDNLHNVFPFCRVPDPVPDEGLPNNFSNVFNYIKLHGLYFERDYKWVGRFQPNQPTNLPSNPDKIYITDYKEIENGNLKLVVEQLEKLQPLTGAIITTVSFRTWGFEDKIYEGPSKEEIEEARKKGLANPTPDHAVTIVGYGRVEGSDDYYICQNSYGTDWGHRGYFKVRCSVVSNIYYPISVYKAKKNTNSGHQDSVDGTHPMEIDTPLLLSNDPMDVDVGQEDSEGMEIDPPSSNDDPMYTD